MDLAALIVSIVALVVSSASVGWNIYAWISSGARLKVEVSNSVVVDHYESTRCLDVSVDNAGRLETTIGSVDFPATETQKIVMAPHAFVGDHPPKTLAPGGSTSFTVSHARLIPALADNNVDLKLLKVRVGTGHGDFTAKLPEGVMTHLRDGIDQYRSDPEKWDRELA